MTTLKKEEPVINPTVIPMGRKLSVTISRTGKMSKQDKAIQTLYRDSEAQTVPWRPEVIFKRRGKGPRVAPDCLIVGETPLTLEDMIAIERARQKQAWEDTLPRMSSKKNDLIRLSCITSIVLNEIAYREARLDAHREERLELSRKYMQDARMMMLKKLKTRLQKMREEKTEQNLRVIDYWSRQFRRNMRKLTVNCLKLTGKMASFSADVTNFRDSPFNEGFSFKSDTTSPLPGEDVGFSRHLAGFSGIELLEKQIAVSSQPKFSKSEKPSKSENVCSRTLRNRENEFEMLRTGEKGKQSDEKSSSPSLRRRVRFSFSRRTEEEQEASEDREEKFQFSLLLGKLIKGRALQTTFFEHFIQYKTSGGKFQRLHPKENLINDSCHNCMNFGISCLLCVHESLGTATDLEFYTDAITIRNKGEYHD